MRTRKPRISGFSLVELVVVIVIIGIIAAMAIPRLSRGTAGAADSAVAGNLAIIRNAINIYQAEHNGDFPSAANIANELTMYTDLSGGTNATRDATHVYGPYLHAVPPCPVGDQTAPTAIAVSVAAPIVVAADTGGWIYNETTGEFRANTNTTDDDGTGYDTY
jgi:prepilin-type N-terminal cleavage/methylation domain-containing protein